MLSGCKTVSPDPIKPATRIIDTFCATYVPVYTSAKDTQVTRDAVNKNNAVWLERCDEEWQKAEAARKAAVK
jgi:hypothetical protein